MRAVALAAMLWGSCVLAGILRHPSVEPEIPRVWDEAALAEWATPVAGLNVRPAHMPAAEYYAKPVDNLKTYPVYAPGREPAGYWDNLQTIGPAALLDARALTTESDWIAAGKRVFDEADAIHLRTFDPQFINLIRNAESFARLGAEVLADGTLPDLRWVPTEKGVALGFPACSVCHSQRHRDGRVIPGAPSGGPALFRGTALVIRAHIPNRVPPGAAPFVVGPEPVGETAYQSWGVPWLKDDVHLPLKAITREQLEQLSVAFLRSGGVPRWNGSIYYPAKTPDLIGIKDRKYLDHTATHLHRNIGDLMRYAALVTTAESTDFGPHRMLAAGTARVAARRSDEALYALARYLYSLEPPANPHPFDANARAGEAVFKRERCVTCHEPPLYTNNKLTLAAGFSPPSTLPTTLDIMRRSVGTDAGLALATRKGTGYYKVPSLKGVWYRPRLLHDGAVASLEEMFDSARLKDDHVPAGWIPFGHKTHAIRGHRFGLSLSATERAQLIAFLRTR